MKERIREGILFCVIVGKEFVGNRLFYMANAMTYRMIMAFFPFLIFLLSLLKFINYDTTVFIMNILEYIPGSIGTVVEKFLENAELSNTLMSVSLIYGIWSATRGFRSIIEGMNRCSAAEETRNFIVVWLSCFVLVFIFTAYILLSLVSVVFNGMIIKFLFMIPILEPVAFILQRMPLGIMNWLLTVALVLIFYEFTAARKFKFKELLPGAVFTILTWIGATFVFSLYTQINTNAFHIYGSIAGIFITIFWVNMLAATLLCGAQLNAVILNYKEYREKYISLFERYAGILRGKIDEKTKK